MEFWTFSGINSPYDATSMKHIDYVWPFIAPKLVGFEPDRKYASQLGTSDLYPPARNVISLHSESMLDNEAKTLAADQVNQGELVGKTVKIMLVAPKTTTRPPTPDSLLVEIYWNPNDYVPNQSLIHPDSLTYWRKFARGGGKVWPVENRLGHGLGYGHDFEGFVVDSPHRVKRVRIQNPGSNVRRYRWIRANGRAPSPTSTLGDWLQDSDNDLVMLGHSQGCNMIMHFIERGFT